MVKTIQIPIHVLNDEEKLNLRHDALPQLARDITEICRSDLDRSTLAREKDIFWLWGAMLQYAVQRYTKLSRDLWVDDVLQSGGCSFTQNNLSFSGVAISTSQQLCDPTAADFTMDEDMINLLEVRIKYGAQSDGVLKRKYHRGISMADFDLSSGWCYEFCYS